MIAIHVRENSPKEPRANLSIYLQVKRLGVSGRIDGEAWWWIYHRRYGRLITKLGRRHRTIQF